MSNCTGNFFKLQPDSVYSDDSGQLNWNVGPLASQTERRDSEERRKLRVSRRNEKVRLCEVTEKKEKPDDIFVGLVIVTHPVTHFYCLFTSLKQEKEIEKYPRYFL